jgi:hypothetical protein
MPPTAFRRSSGRTTASRPGRSRRNHTGKARYVPAERQPAACLSGARRLVGDPSRPLGDRGEIAGLDQFVRLKTAEGARTGDRQAERRRRVRVGHGDDGRAVVLSEHPVVRLKAAADRLHQLPHHRCPVGGLRDEPLDRLAGEAEQEQVFCHHYHPQVRGRRSGLALRASIAPAVPGFNPGMPVTPQAPGWDVLVSFVVSFSYVRRRSARTTQNEPQQPGSVTRTSTSGKQHATGQAPQQIHSEPNAPDRCFGAKRPSMLADRTRTDIRPARDLRRQERRRPAEVSAVA